MNAITELHGKLPPGTGLEWTGLSYEARLSGGQAPMVYALSLVIVFLCLAALYESGSQPLAVMLVVQLGVIGAVLAAVLTGPHTNIYLQASSLPHTSVPPQNHT